MIQTASPRNPIATIAALFLVIAIDQMGITFVFPILTPLFMDPHSQFAVNLTVGSRDFYYGLCLALYPLLMFFSAPLLGDLSDQIGRKKILLTCLLGSAVGFFLSAFAVTINSLALLLFSRAVAGFFSGSQFIAQAAIADISPSDKKAVNLSYIIVAIAVGMIFGPLVGGFFSDVKLAAWFTYATPFNVAAILAIINAIILAITFTETYQVTQKIKLKLFKGLALLVNAFTDSKIRLLSIILFCMIFGWNLYFQSISWYLLQRFGFDAVKIGLFSGYLGVAFVFALTVILRLFNKYIAATKTVLICLAVMAIALCLAFTIPHEAIEWLSGSFVIAPVGITYTLLLAFFSNTVGADKQGWIMGVTGSVGAIAWAAAGIVAGPLGYLHITMPLLVSMIFAVIAFLGSVRYWRTH